MPIDWDAQGYLTIPHVPILDEHEIPDGGRDHGRIGGDKLRRIAANNNARISRTGDYTPLVIGHTRDGAAEKDQPEIVGYADNFIVGPWGGGVEALYADFHYMPGKHDLPRRFPRRSVELWMSRWEVDPISVLGATTPERDLGVLMFSRSRSGEVVYRTESPYRAAKKGNAMPDTPNPDAQAPDELVEAVLQKIQTSDVWRQLEATAEKLQAALGQMEGAETPPDEPDGKDGKGKKGKGDKDDEDGEEPDGDEGQSPGGEEDFDYDDMLGGEQPAPGREPMHAQDRESLMGSERERPYRTMDDYGDDYDYDGDPRQYEDFGYGGATSGFVPGAAGPPMRRHSRHDYMPPPHYRQPAPTPAPRQPTEDPRRLARERDDLKVKLSRAEAEAKKLKEEVKKFQRATLESQCESRVKQLQAEGYEVDTNGFIDQVDKAGGDPKAIDSTEQYVRKFHRQAPVGVPFRQPAQGHGEDEAASRNGEVTKMSREEREKVIKFALENGISGDNAFQKARHAMMAVEAAARSGN